MKSVFGINTVHPRWKDNCPLWCFYLLFSNKHDRYRRKLGLFLPLVRFAVQVLPFDVPWCPSLRSPGCGSSPRIRWRLWFVSWDTVTAAYSHHSAENCVTECTGYRSTEEYNQSIDLSINQSIHPLIISVGSFAQQTCIKAEIEGSKKQRIIIAVL